MKVCLILVIYTFCYFHKRCRKYIHINNKQIVNTVFFILDFLNYLHELWIIFLTRLISVSLLTPAGFFFLLYLRHIRSSVANTILISRNSEQVFSLRLLIAQAVLYNSTIWHHSSFDFTISQEQEKLW